MSDKTDKEKIAELEAENKRLRAKIKPKTTYVDKNMVNFEKLIEYIDKTFQLKNHKGKTTSRYFFTRPSKKDDKEEETCFKLNVLVKDLIEYKAKANVGEDSSARISMDTGSLIRSLTGGREGDLKPQKVKALKEKLDRYIKANADQQALIEGYIAEEGKQKAIRKDLKNSR